LILHERLAFRLRVALGARLEIDVRLFPGRYGTLGGASGKLRGRTGVRGSIVGVGRAQEPEQGGRQALALGILVVVLFGCNRTL
jgi:hypothetical protein